MACDRSPHRGLVTVAALIALMLSSCGSGGTAARPPPVEPTPTSPSSSTPTIAPKTTPVAPSTIAVLPTTSPSTIPATTQPPAGPAQVITGGDPKRRIVALTFDAGSDTGNTARIVDLLAAAHIQATFGITGQWARANPDLLRRIVADGHQVVNHTFDHRSFTGTSTGTTPLTRTERLAELSQAEALIHREHGGGHERLDAASLR